MPRTQKRRADQRCKPSQLRAPCFPLLRTGMSSCADDTQCICCGWQSQRYCMHARLHQNASPRGSCEHMSQPGCAAGAGTTLCIFASSVQEGVQLLRWYAATSEPECACAAGIRLWMLCAATRSSCWLARRGCGKTTQVPQYILEDSWGGGPSSCFCRATQDPLSPSPPLSVNLPANSTPYSAKPYAALGCAFCPYVG